MLIFTFFVNYDYNIKIIKIALFSFLFGLNYAINALFFNDSSMHQIYVDEGEFNFIYQLPQIIYSTIISNIIIIVMKILSLSEKDILKIKKEKKETIKKSIEIIKILKIKFILFFSICFAFLIFFWIYLGAFCAVYINTQLYLIKDTLISLVVTLIYPFVISILPGIFRIPAITAKNKDKQLFYKLSKIMQLL